MWIHHLIHIHMCTRSPKVLSPVLTCMTLRDIQFLIHRAPSDVGPPLQVELFWEGCPQDLGVCLGSFFQKHICEVGTLTWALVHRHVGRGRAAPNWSHKVGRTELSNMSYPEVLPLEPRGRNNPTIAHHVGTMQTDVHRSWQPPNRTREPPESSGGVHSTASSDALRWPCWWTAWMQPLGRGHPSPKLSALFWS